MCLRHLMSKKVYIIETSNAPHETSALNTLKIFDKKGYAPVLCLNSVSEKRVYKLIGEAYKDIKVTKISGLLSVLKLNRKINKEDYVFYNTILLRNLWNVLIISLFTKNNIFHLRNINSWFAKPKGKTSLKNKILGLLLHMSKKHILYRRAKFFAVGSYNMKEFLSTKSDKNTFVVPFGLFREQEKESTIKKEKVFTFVIPGTIDLNRKNLSVIREATLLFNKQDLKKFKVILLGRPVRDSDKNFVKNWKEEIGSALKYYDEFIPDTIFENTLKDADIIMGVLNMNYQDKYGNEEVYGVSKDTGIEAHAIAYRKPLLINEEYEVDSFLKTLTIKFKEGKDCYNKMYLLMQKKEAMNNQALCLDSYNIDELIKQIPWIK